MNRAWQCKAGEWRNETCRHGAQQPAHGSKGTRGKMSAKAWGKKKRARHSQSMGNDRM